MGPGDISAQLSKILSSPQFVQAAALSRFLRFVVEASQAGQTVKEYPIGVEVFNRGKDFDPRIDTIVRVQAAKLRSKLLEYYSSVGAEDPIVISLPKGGYAPEIRERAPSAPAAITPAPPDRSRIAVLPFVNMSSDQENEYFSDGLTEELINRLARVPSLQVVARTSVFSFKGRNEDLRELGAKLNVGTVMEGSVRKSGDQLRVTAQLIDVQSGYHLFSQTYQRELKNVFAVQDELAQAVVDEIAPFGATRDCEDAGGESRRLQRISSWPLRTGQSF
jgi:serine/threonine-protein kinase